VLLFCWVFEPIVLNQHPSAHVCLARGLMRAQVAERWYRLRGIGELRELLPAELGPPHGNSCVVTMGVHGALVNLRVSEQGGL
jgi:hypothetical protein